MGWPEWWRDGRRRRRVLAAVVLVVLVNAPVLSSAYQDQRVASAGVDVVADVVGEEVRTIDGEPRYLLGYQLPRSVDPGRPTRPAEVDAATFGRAVETGEIGVRVLESRPAASRVDGEVRRRLGLQVTLVVDAVLVLAVAAGWLWSRRRRAPEPETGDLSVLADSDVARTDDDPGERRLEGDRLLLVGVLAGTAYGEARLALPARSARVVLEGRVVLAEPGERVRVVCRPLG